MQKKHIQGVDLIFDDEGKDAVEPIQLAIEKAVPILRTWWKLDAPEDCRVHIMTSWPQFLWHATTWPWKILMALSAPFWIPRVVKIWPLAGGWAQKFGKRRAVGVKPPHLLRASDRSMGDQIFVRRNDLRKEVQGITCHELTHAFTAHLRLPAWLNEGLAMVAVEKILGEPTVQHMSLELLEKFAGVSNRINWQKPRVQDRDAILYLYVRGYWLTRYLEETNIELLREFLSRRHRRAELENKLAAAYGKQTDSFWRGVDRTLVSYFTSA